jgi:hypothetical protein
VERLYRRSAGLGHLLWNDRRVECRRRDNGLCCDECRQAGSQDTRVHRTVLHKKEHKTVRGLGHWHIVRVAVRCVPIVRVLGLWRIPVKRVMDKMRTRRHDQREQEENDTEATEVTDAFSTQHVRRAEPASGQGPIC